MVEYENQKYYSCNEIAKAFEEQIGDFKELKTKFQQVYKKDNEYIFVPAYIQTKLYTAAEKKKIPYVTYYRGNSKLVHKAFAIKDMMNFLNLPEAAKIGKTVLNKIIGYHPAE